MGNPFISMVHVGFGGMIAAQRIVALLGAESSPTRRMIRQSREEGRVIDMTCGRKTKAVIVLDSGHVALAALHPETIAGRLKGLSQSEMDTHEAYE
jgi:extracellular matrix regulatory protein A